MQSTRLPGKIMRKLAGRTVLSHVIERSKAISGVDIVCCAIPENVDCDPIAEEAEKSGAVISRGSESDVLDRYFQAAKMIDATIIMRITSDCPLIDPAICAEILDLREKHDLDYACNNEFPTWPHGLDCEAVTFEWLERAAHEAVEPLEREHVTPYIRSHPDVRSENLVAPNNDHVDHRWTLDTPEDFQFLSALFEKLPTGPESFCYQVPLDIVTRHPELSALNSHLSGTHHRPGEPLDKLASKS